MTAPDAGLCDSCTFAGRQRSARGAEFLRCGLSDRDPAYRRYPPLPVLRCSGHRPIEPARRPGPAGPGQEPTE